MLSLLNRWSRKSPITMGILELRTDTLGYKRKLSPIKSPALWMNMTPCQFLFPQKALNFRKLSCLCLHSKQRASECSRWQSCTSSAARRRTTGSSTNTCRRCSTPRGASTAAGATTSPGQVSPRVSSPASSGWFLRGSCVSTYSLLPCPSYFWWVYDSWKTTWSYCALLYDAISSSRSESTRGDMRNKICFSFDVYGDLMMFVPGR